QAISDWSNQIVLQGFNWESHGQPQGWWRHLASLAPAIAAAGFTAVWLPPASSSLAPQGGVRVIADVVVNHRVGLQQGEGGQWTRFDGTSMPWDESAVTCDTGGKGNPSSGNVFEGVSNIDHSQPFVRRDLTAWLTWLQADVGFSGFRFDYAKGYSAAYVRGYVQGAQLRLCVGEYWDTCNYVGAQYDLDYDQDSHRGRIVEWVEGADRLATAFDFTTKAILQEAVKRKEWWRLKDKEGRPPGVMGLVPSHAVTFVDNHDTGSTQAHWPFPSHAIIQGYAYILTHPGIPSVFYDHFFDWGPDLKNQIQQLVSELNGIGPFLRLDVTCMVDHFCISCFGGAFGSIWLACIYCALSSIQILAADDSRYAAIVGRNLCVKIGDGEWSPDSKEIEGVLKSGDCCDVSEDGGIGSDRTSDRTRDSRKWNLITCHYRDSTLVEGSRWAIRLVIVATLTSVAARVRIDWMGNRFLDFAHALRWSSNTKYAEHSRLQCRGKCVIEPSCRVRRLSQLTSKLRTKGGRNLPDQPHLEGSRLESLSAPPSRMALEIRNIRVSIRCTSVRRRYIGMACSVFLLALLTSGTPPVSAFEHPTGDSYTFSDFHTEQGASNGYTPRELHLGVNSVDVSHPVAAGVDGGTIPVCIARTRLPARPRLRGVSRGFHVLRVTATIPAVGMPRGAFASGPKFEFCVHWNASQPLGDCPRGAWRTADRKGRWVVLRSPFEGAFIDVKQEGGVVGDHDVSIKIDEDLEPHRAVFFVLGFLLMLLAGHLSSMVAFYYGGGMTLGVLLVVIVILYQVMRLLPLGRKSSLQILLYGSLMGFIGVIITYVTGAVKTVMEPLGLGDDVISPVVVFVLVLVVLIGAALGFWVVRKFILSPTGELDPPTVSFVKWGLRIIAATLLIMSSADAIIASSLLLLSLSTTLLLHLLSPRALALLSPTSTPSATPATSFLARACAHKSEQASEQEGEVGRMGGAFSPPQQYGTPPQGPMGGVGGGQGYVTPSRGVDGSPYTRMGTPFQGPPGTTRYALFVPNFVCVSLALSSESTRKSPLGTPFLFPMLCVCLLLSLLPDSLPSHALPLVLLSSRVLSSSFPPTGTPRTPHPSSPLARAVCPSSFHRTPHRRHLTPAQAAAISHECTQAALQELAYSPGFGQWVLHNFDRIAITPRILREERDEAEIAATAEMEEGFEEEEG
ncbi:unnamed protein product, partial [Closterium sp. NIES-53]